MGRLLSVMTCVVLTASLVAAADKPDPLAQARLLYNQRKFQEAVSAAERARLAPESADSADLIGARAYLERFRETGASDDLTNARQRLRRLDPRRFDPRERAEFILGLGEALYFDEAFGAAATLFAAVLDAPDALPTDAHERVLDWWASAVDRDGQPRPEAQRQPAYDRVRARMQDELVMHADSATASYWLAAAARGRGDLQAAWDAAEAGWLRASLAGDRGVALREDLDRLMLQAIVPERAKMLAQPAESLRLEWERFKDQWTNG